jgi:transcription elongation factor Elf1
MARGRRFKCPYAGCGSTNTISKGVRKTKTMGVRMLRYCKDCGRKFTPQNQKPAEQVEEQTMGA